MISKDNYRLQLTISKFQYKRMQWLHEKAIEKEIINKDIKLNDFIRMCLDRGITEIRKEASMPTPYEEAEEILKRLGEKWKKNQ